MSSKYNQEQIDDEQEVTQEKQQEQIKYAKVEELEANDQKQEYISKQESENQQQIIYERKTEEFIEEGKETKVQISTGPINHQQLGKYANDVLDIEEEDQGIKLKIIGNETRGSALSKYTVYIIKGYDSKGEISVCRRFSEFHAMRIALCKRWPGCFIPSIPEKNYISKNDKDQIVKRERYLNDFFSKIIKIPHLYSSEQFQTLIRSGNEDISAIFNSWSTPTYESIINKYKESFNDLAGKQIDQGSSDIIALFYISLQKNQALVDKYRYHAKNLAQAKDKQNQNFSLIFSKIIPNYQQYLLAEYVNGSQQQLVFLNSNEVKMCEQSPIVNEICEKNPYWLYYDLMKHEQRDGKAFMEMIKRRQSLQSRKHSLEAKIKDNQKNIVEISSGKKNMKSMTSKSSNDELKYKMEVETQQLKKQKTFLCNLLDIITALIVYVEIPQYKQSKIKFYHSVLKRIGGYQINAVQIYGEVWQNIMDSSRKIQKH